MSFDRGLEALGQTIVLLTVLLSHVEHQYYMPLRGICTYPAAACIMIP